MFPIGLPSTMPSLPNNNSSAKNDSQNWLVIGGQNDNLVTGILSSFYSGGVSGNSQINGIGSVNNLVMIGAIGLIAYLLLRK